MFKGVTQTSEALLKLVYTLYIVNELFWSKFIAELVGLYVGKSVCDRNQSFTDNTLTAAMAHWQNRGLLI